MPGASFRSSAAFWRGTRASSPTRRLKSRRAAARRLAPADHGHLLRLALFGRRAAGPRARKARGRGRGASARGGAHGRLRRKLRLGFRGRFHHLRRRRGGSEMERDPDPARDGLVASQRGTERPLPRRDDCRFVQIGPAGLQDLDVAHVTVGIDRDREHDVSVFAFGERRRRVHRVDVALHHGRRDFRPGLSGASAGAWAAAPLVAVRTAACAATRAALRIILESKRRWRMGSYDEASRRTESDPGQEFLLLRCN